jgi:tripartite ATP-independent transporter DctM subunit
MGILLLIIFLVFTFMNIPIVFSIGISAIVVLILEKVSLLIVIQRLFTGSDSFILTAVPFFVLAGSLMGTGGITTRLVGFAQCLVGHITGGLTFVTIVAEMILSGITGSATADTAAMGGIMIPAMEKEGYEKRFACALTAAAGTLGIIIPPSIPMILYAIIAGVSIGKLFLAGFLPGVMVGVGMMVPAYYISKKRNYPKRPRVTFREFIRSLFTSAFALFMPVVIIGGIVGGVVTPTEAGVLAVAYAAFGGLVVYRELKISHLPKILLETVIMSASIMIIMAVASIFGWILANLEIPKVVAEFFLGISHNKYIILFLINIFLLIVGCFVDLGPALIITVPILLPLVKMLGVDPIHFGLIVIINLGIGLFTPPVGTNLYVACAVGKISLSDISKGIVPFIIWSVIVLMIVTYWPQSVLFVPNLFMK